MRAHFSSSLLTACLLSLALILACPLPSAGQDKLPPKKERQLASPPDLALQSGRDPDQIDKTPEYYDAVAAQDLEREDYPAACQTYDEALAAYPGHARLLHNAAVARDQWAAKAQARSLWGDAFSICADSVARGLNPEHFKKRIVVIVQSGGREAISNRDWAGLKTWLSNARARFPDLPQVKTLIPALYAEALDSLPMKDEADYLSQGKTLLSGYQEFQGTAAPYAKLVMNWSQPLLEKLKANKDWEKAVEVIRDVRDLLPADATLRDYEIAIWNKWAQDYTARAEWDLAAIAYERALERFPNEKLFQKNLETCRKNSQQNQPTPASAQ